jgi:hypothetical protein
LRVVCFKAIRSKEFRKLRLKFRTPNARDKFPLKFHKG